MALIYKMEGISLKETANFFQASEKLRLIRKIYYCFVFAVGGEMQS